MRINHYQLSKQSITTIKYFALFYCVFSVFYLIYNIYHLEQFYQQYITKIQRVYSYTRRFSSYYNNTSKIYKIKNDYKTNTVSLIVNKTGKVKTLSGGVIKLRTQLNQLTNNNIWTIAVFENPSNYAHFDPIRPEAGFKQ